MKRAEILKDVLYLNQFINDTTDKYRKEVKRINTEPYELSHKITKTDELQRKAIEDIKGLYETSKNRFLSKERKEFEKRSLKKVPSYSEIKNMIEISGGKPSTLLLDKIQEYSNVELFELYANRFELGTIEYEQIMERVEDMKQPHQGLKYINREMPHILTYAMVLANNLNDDTSSGKDFTKYIEELVKNMPVDSEE